MIGSAAAALALLIVPFRAAAEPARAAAPLAAPAASATPAPAPTSAADAMPDAGPTPAVPPADGADPDATAPRLDRDDLGFARSLYDEGDFYRAIGASKRFLYFHPADARVDEAHLLIGQSYLAGQQWAAAAASLEPIVSRGLPGKVGADAAYALAEVRMGAADYDVAALEFRRFGEDYPEDPRAAIAALRVGWARMFSADVLATLDPKKGRAAFREAARELDAIPAGSAEHARAEKLAAGARRIAALPLKHPVLAGTLSAVVPGTGQMYAGRWKDGVIALFVNGLFIGGSIESYLRGNTVAAGVLALFEMGWYTGNIYSAVNSAHRTNDERRAGILKGLRRDLYVTAAPIAVPHGGGGAVALLGGTF